MSNTPRYIVVHTAAWPGDPSAADIDRAHRQNGWSGIGYHYVIRKDGTVERGRAENAVGAHCTHMGMNRQSIGIVFSGHHNEEPWTKAQEDSFLDLVKALRDRYDIITANVIGHRETGAPKDCPGLRINMDDVRQMIVHAILHKWPAPERFQIPPLERIEPQPVVPIPTDFTPARECLQAGLNEQARAAQDRRVELVTTGKPALKSRGVLGGLVAAFGGVLLLIEQIGITPLAALIGLVAGSESAATISETLLAIIVALGGSAAVYGRMKATEQIDG